MRSRVLTTLSVVVVSSALACGDHAAAADQAEVGGDIAAQIAQRVEVREDPTIFALFTMLNAAGYDEESHPEMHPVRRAVRSALVRRLPDSVFARLQAYYTAHAAIADPRAYSVVAMATSGAPNFAPTADWTNDLSKQAQFRSRAGLAAQLRSFGRAFPIDSVYRTQQVAYRAYIADYTAAIRREVTAVLRYARVHDAGELAGSGERGRAVVIPNLLLSYERAYSFVLGGTFYSVEGPQAVVGYNPHEFIHAITNAASYDTARYAVAQRRAAAAYAGVRTLPAMAEFKSLAAFLDENLVRAVALRSRAAVDPAREASATAAAATDALKGFVLVPYFCEQLKTYEKQSQPLRVYYPHLFEQLDAQRELTRWRVPANR